MFYKVQEEMVKKQLLSLYFLYTYKKKKNTYKTIKQLVITQNKAILEN